MKKLFSSVPIAVFALWSGALMSEHANAAISEHRPVCAPDGSGFIYMLQSERTQNDWELYQMVFSTQVQNRLTRHEGWDGYANGVIDGTETSLEMIDPASGNKTTLRTSIGRIYGLSWSPDGDKIAFVDAPGGADDDADIFIYNIGEQSFQQITDDPAWEHMPEFCHNNHTLFFTSYRSGEERIYQVDPDPEFFLKVERVQK